MYECPERLAAAGALSLEFVAGKDMRVMLIRNRIPLISIQRPDGANY